MSGCWISFLAGSLTTFKRREMASALEARTKFPQLVTGDEKRVRFVVVHGLEIMERPITLPLDDAEWYVSLSISIIPLAQLMYAQPFSTPWLFGSKLVSQTLLSVKGFHLRSHMSSKSDEGSGANCQSDQFLQFRRMVRFKRLTGRHEAAISPRDYNFFSPRVKHRRPQHTLSNVSVLPVRTPCETTAGLLCALKSN